MSLSHDNCDLCFVRGCQLSRFWLSPIRPCRSYIKESVIIKTKVGCGKILERFFSCHFNVSVLVIVVL